MADQDRLAEIKAQLAAVDQNERVRSLGPSLARVYLNWLIGECDRLRGLLARLEWAGSDYVDDDGSGTPMCPVCKHWRPAGHAPGCELAEMLARTQKGAPPSP